MNRVTLKQMRKEDRNSSKKVNISLMKGLDEIVITPKSKSLAKINK